VPLTIGTDRLTKGLRASCIMSISMILLVFGVSASKATAQALSTGAALTKPAKNSTKDGGASAPKPAGDGREVPAQLDVFRIGLDDQLMISVWHEPELSMGVVVRPDGMITLPLINDVHVAGLRPIELQQLLTERFKPFVSEPQVTVTVQGIRSRKVFLVGNGNKQGAFILDGGETVLQLLASAGGLGPFAKGDSIHILRTENGKQVRIPFQYKKAIKGRGSEDIVLMPGDVVVVP
jgi:polysaccharide export outer membrane protein